MEPPRSASTLGDLDLHLLGEGTHPRTMNGTEGVSFAVWAPNARSVSVVGDFNGWDGRAHPMAQVGPNGFWEIFVPGLTAGMLYKFELHGPNGTLLPPQGRSLRLPLRTRAGHGLHRPRPAGPRLERRRLAGSPPQDQGPSVAHQHLRTPPGLMAAAAGRLLHELPGDRRGPGALRQLAGLHPRATAARDRASLRSLLGLPAPRHVRAHQPLREPGGFQGLRGHPASGWPGRHPRLGARPLPRGRP